MFNTESKLNDKRKARQWRIERLSSEAHDSRRPTWIRKAFDPLKFQTDSLEIIKRSAESFEFRSPYKEQWREPQFPKGLKLGCTIINANRNFGLGSNQFDPSFPQKMLHQRASRGSVVHVITIAVEPRSNLNRCFSWTNSLKWTSALCNHPPSVNTHELTVIANKPNGLVSLNLINYIVLNLIKRVLRISCKSCLIKQTAY